MEITLSTQEFIRDKMLSNIDINIIESFIHERTKLVELLSQVYDELFQNNEYDLNPQDRRYMIDSIADEITGFDSSQRINGR